MNFYKDPLLKDLLPLKMKCLHMAHFTFLHIPQLSDTWKITYYSTNSFLEKLLENNTETLAIYYLIRSARTKIILYLVFWNLVLQTKQCLFQCCNHWLSRQQLFQNSFLRKQGWWDLKPIPVSLVDFWMHCSTSILFDRRAGVSRLVVETGGQAARNCTSLCSQQDRRQTLLLMTAFGRRWTTVNYCRHKLRLLTSESTPGSPHMHPCRRLSGGLP